MVKALIAFSLSMFVFPGLGQLYNKEKKKGILIIGFVVVVIFIFVYSLSVFIEPYLPKDMGQLSFDRAKEIINELSTEFPRPFFYYNILLLFVWLYSAVDAGLVAFVKQKPKGTNKGDVQVEIPDA